MDLYKILEIKPTASEAEIKKAYFKLAKIYHPDKNNSPDATEKFQKINMAYEILINSETRYEYLKMDNNDRLNFIEIIEKILNGSFNMESLNQYNIKLDKSDIEYLKKNFFDFIKILNINEILKFIKKGIVPKKTFNNIISCSESENDIYDETCATYFYNLPLYLQKYNKLDIILDLNINICDITCSNKRKIKIKRNMDDESITSTFVFNLSHPYIIYFGAGDMDNGDYGNLIIRLLLPNNLYWNQNLILIEQKMSLYELIYGLDIELKIDNDNKININSWIPSRDGFFIELSNIPNYNFAIKLVLDYNNTIENQSILKKYFS